MKKFFDYSWSLFWMLFSASACILAYPTALLGTAPRKRPSVPKRPILLVHGYLSHASHWVYQRYKLEKGGLGPVYAINLGSPFNSIENFAAKVRQKATEIAKVEGREDLILIGHSMGGIVSVYYALHFAPKGSVTDVITMGSPLRGSRMARLGVGECTQQMRLKSPFLERLIEKLITQGEFRLYQMASETDLTVRPLSAAIVNHSNAKISMFPRLGHMTFLFSRQVSDKIIAHLNNSQ